MNDLSEFYNTEPKISEFDGVDVFEFFNLLLAELKPLKNVDPMTRLMLFCALSYLRIEADRPRIKRNLEVIAYIWKGAQPALSRLGLLTKYRKSDRLRGRIKLFVVGRF